MHPVFDFWLDPPISLLNCYSMMKMSRSFQCNICLSFVSDEFAASSPGQAKNRILEQGI